jgi:hypothetical protein
MIPSLGTVSPCHRASDCLTFALKCSALYTRSSLADLMLDQSKLPRNLKRPVEQVTLRGSEVGPSHAFIGVLPSAQII